MSSRAFQKLIRLSGVAGPLALDAAEGFAQARHVSHRVFEVSLLLCLEADADMDVLFQSSRSISPSTEHEIC